MARWHRAGWVVWAAWAALGAQAQGLGGGSLPQRNLLVEWRMNGGSARQAQGGGLRGGELTVDSRGGVHGRAGVSVTTTTRTRTESSMQQMQVLNGGQARLYLGSSRPVTQWQFMVDGAGNGAPSGPAWKAWQSTTLVDTGRGLTVRPRWTGGSRVAVELEARVAQQAAYAPEGQIESSEVMTTVLLPLGEWTAVAQRGGQIRQRQRGILSTEDIGQDDNEVLEMRVSAP